MTDLHDPHTNCIYCSPGPFAPSASCLWCKRWTPELHFLLPDDELPDDERARVHGICHGCMMRAREVDRHQRQQRWVVTSPADIMPIERWRQLGLSWVLKRMGWF